MPTTKTPTRNGSFDSSPSATRIFELLSNQRRRFVLHYLTRQVGAVGVDDLADQIALWEGEHTRDRYERICTGLVHNHLPKLHDAGIIEYNPERETVRVRDQASKLTPHLDIVAPADLE